MSAHSLVLFCGPAELTKLIMHGESGSVLMGSKEQTWPQIEQRSVGT